MAYATATELSDALGADAYLVLADRGGDGVADVDAVAQALDDASSLADSYLAKWLPIAPTPPALRRAVCDVAAYRLAGDRATEALRQRFEDALKWLRDVASGAAALGLPPPAATPGGFVFGSAERELTRASLRGVL